MLSGMLVVLVQFPRKMCCTLHLSSVECVRRIAAPVSATLATKVLKQRPGTVQKAKDVYLAFCELEQADTVVVRQQRQLYIPRSSAVLHAAVITHFVNVAGSRDESLHRQGPQSCCCCCRHCDYCSQVSCLACVPTEFDTNADTSGRAHT